MFTFVRIRLDLAFPSFRRSLPPFHLFSLAARLEDDCRGSSLHGEIYDRKLPDDPYAVKRFQKPASPVILTPPVLWQMDPIDGTYPLDLVLVGSCGVHAGSLVVRLIRLLENRYDTAVQGVRLTGAYHNQTMEFADLERIAALPLSIITLDDLTRQLEASSAGNEVRIRFTTPLRLLRHGSVLQRVTGGDVLRSLLRRVSSLGFHYCRYEFPVDYRYLSERAADIAYNEGGLRGHGAGERGGEGVMGEVLFRGDLEPFFPFLAAGSLVHLGKGAASGYGCYELLPAV